MGFDGQLVLTRCRVVEALEPVARPLSPGSPLRGAFAHPFRVLWCPARPVSPLASWDHWTARLGLATLYRELRG